MLLDKALPRTDVVLFGVICQFCGKNDRIRLLEPPEELVKDLDKTNFEDYCQLWNGFQEAHAGLAVCKFCHNVGSLNVQMNAVVPLY